MGRYCAVINCRSGYKLTRQEQRLKKHSEVTKFSIFRFPKSEEARRRWAASIGRNPESLYGVNWGVCELHFRAEHFCVGANRRGKDRTRRRLRDDAIPFVPNNVPQTAHSTPRGTLLATPSARRLRHEEKVKNQVEAFLADDNVTDINDLCTKLHKEELPTGFRYVATSSYVIRHMSRF